MDGRTSGLVCTLMLTTTRLLAENEEEEEMLTSHAGNSCGFVGDSRVGLHREFGIPFILSCKPGVLLLLQFARLSDF